MDSIFGNIPFFTLYQFEIYRIFFASLVGNSFLTLLMICLFYPAMGARLENSLVCSTLLLSQSLPHPILGLCGLLISAGDLCSDHQPHLRHALFGSLLSWCARGDVLGMQWMVDHSLCLDRCGVYAGHSCLPVSSFCLSLSLPICSVSLWLSLSGSLSLPIFALSVSVSMALSLLTSLFSDAGCSSSHSLSPN
jgi:hypothetical protein